MYLKLILTLGIYFTLILTIFKYNILLEEPPWQYSTMRILFSPTACVLAGRGKGVFTG